MSKDLGELVNEILTVDREIYSRYDFKSLLMKKYKLLKGNVAKIAQIFALCTR